MYKIVPGCESPNKNLQKQATHSVPKTFRVVCVCAEMKGLCLFEPIKQESFR